MTPLCCPHCGAIIPTANPFNLTPTEHRIYTFMTRHPDSGFDRIMSNVYADDPDGGPRSRSGFNTHILNMKKKLRGVRIVTRSGPGATYRIVKEQH